MITKLLLQEKMTDINAKLTSLEAEVQASLLSLSTFVEKVRGEMQGNDLETNDQVEIEKMNDSIEGYYDDLRSAKSSLHLVESSFRRLGEKDRGVKW